MSRAVDPGPAEAAKELERPEPNWKPGWQQEVLARRMSRLTTSSPGDGDRAGGMPAVARERLERALCRVLERRYPGRRFAMKDQLDTLSHRAAAARTTAADTDGLKDAA